MECHCVIGFRLAKENIDAATLTWPFILPSRQIIMSGTQSTEYAECHLWTTRVFITEENHTSKGCRHITTVFFLFRNEIAATYVSESISEFQGVGTMNRVSDSDIYLAIGQQKQFFLTMKAGMPLALSLVRAQCLHQSSILLRQTAALGRLHAINGCQIPECYYWSMCGSLHGYRMGMVHFESHIFKAPLASHNVLANIWTRAG